MTTTPTVSALECADLLVQTLTPDQGSSDTKAWGLAVSLRAMLAAAPAITAPAREGESHLMVFLKTINMSDLGLYQAEIDHALALDRAPPPNSERIIKALRKGINHLRGRSDSHTIAARKFMEEVKAEVEAAALTARHEAPSEGAGEERFYRRVAEIVRELGPSMSPGAMAATCDRLADKAAVSTRSSAPETREGAGEDWRAEYDRVERIGIEAQRQDELARGTNDPISKSEHEAQASGHWARYERECAKMNAKALRARAPEASPQVEAVAWRYRYPNDAAWQLTQDHDQAFKNTGEVEPLGVIPFRATHPQPAQTPGVGGDAVCWQRLSPRSGWVAVEPDDIEGYSARGQEIRALGVITATQPDRGVEVTGRQIAARLKPDLFSEDKVTAHRAASPFSVASARVDAIREVEVVLEARASITALAAGESA